MVTDIIGIFGHCPLSQVKMPQIMEAEFVSIFRWNRSHRIQSSMMSRGITWFITMGATVGIRNYKLQNSQVRKRGNIGLNQSLIYINPCTSLSTSFFLFATSSFQQPKERTVLRQKNVLRGIFLSPCNPTPKYADENGDIKAGSPLFLYHLKIQTAPDFDTLWVQ